MPPSRSVLALVTLVLFGVSIQVIDPVPGAEFAAGASLTGKNVKADGTIFIPDSARHLRAVIVAVESWPGADRGAVDAATGLALPDARPFVDLAAGRFVDHAWRRLSQQCQCALLHLRLGTVRPEPTAGVAANGVVVHSGISDRVVRNAGEGGADTLFLILQRLGEDSAHRELASVPLVLWGWSAPGNFGTTFAERYPERTIAFIRYHSHLRGQQTDIDRLRHVPALLIAGGRDAQAGTEDAEALWKRGRSTGAPWTFAIEAAAGHADERMVADSSVLILRWIASVIDQRLGPGTTLRTIPVDEGWLGDRPDSIAPYKTFSGVKNEASWLPDEATARGWQSVMRAR